MPSGREASTARPPRPQARAVWLILSPACCYANNPEHARALVCRESFSIRDVYLEHTIGYVLFNGWAGPSWAVVILPRRANIAEIAQTPPRAPYRTFSTVIEAKGYLMAEHKAQVEALRELRRQSDSTRRKAAK